MTIAMPRFDRSTAAERGLTIADFLVPVTVAERLNTRVRDSILIGTGALFIYLTSLVVVPHDPIPWTGQTFGVLMVGGALGLRRGLLAVALYVLLGYVGLPFFAEGKSGAVGHPRAERRLPDRVHRGRRRRRPAGRAWLGSSLRRSDRDDADRQRDHLRDRAAVAGRRRGLHAQRDDRGRVSPRSSSGTR